MKSLAAAAFAALAVVAPAQAAVTGSVKGIPALARPAGSVVAVGADGAVKAHALLGPGLGYRVGSPNVPQLLFANVFDLASGRAFSGHSFLFSPSKVSKLNVQAKPVTRALQAATAQRRTGAANPAIGVHEIDIVEGNHLIRSGASDMLITDLSNAPSPCRGVVVEVDPRYIAAIRAEIALQRSQYVDSSTRVSYNPTPETHAVHGTATANAASGTMTVSITLTDLRTGKVVLRDKASGAWTGGFDKALQALANRIAKAACAKVAKANEFWVDVRGSASESWTYHKTIDAIGSKYEEDGSGSLAGSFTSTQRAKVVLDEPPAPVPPTLLWGPGAGVVTTNGTRTGSRRTSCTGECQNFQPQVWDTSGCGSKQGTGGVGPLWDPGAGTLRATLLVFADVGTENCPQSEHELGQLATAEAPLTVDQLRTQDVITLHFHDVQHDGQPGGAITADSDDATFDWTLTLTRIS